MSTKPAKPADDAFDDFEGIVFAAECPPCECCGEPWCEKHQMHYADCACRGPHSDEDDEAEK